MLSLKPSVFVILSALIEERSGLHYDLEHMDLIADKVSLRAVEAGFDSLLDYYYYLRYDLGSGPEIDALLNALVVHETYFFRELDSLRQMVSEIALPLVASGKRPRIWSAACSTGEEPFTIAMLLHERGLRAAVDLVASDLSAVAVARAQLGVFGPRSLRGEPQEDLAARWLVIDEGHVRVRDELKRGIDWRRANLLDADAVAALGPFDVVICRNVLIYFGDSATRRVLASLTTALRPSGALLVGVAESLLRFGTELSCEERGGTFFYRKDA